jgi:hypothetical protein
MSVTEICKEVRRLCEDERLQFFFAVPEMSEWSVTNCKHLRKLVDYHKELETSKQEPSEDCVSRQVIDQNIYDYAESNGLSYANMKNYILDVPSATPTRKKWKWIAKENIHGLEKFYKCSNCGNHCLYEYVEIGFKNAKTKYCPNCGAEMESEE